MWFSFRSYKTRMKRAISACGISPQTSRLTHFSPCSLLQLPAFLRIESFSYTVTKCPEFGVTITYTLKIFQKTLPNISTLSLLGHYEGPYLMCCLLDWGGLVLCTGFLSVGRKPHTLGTAEDVFIQPGSSKGSFMLNVKYRYGLSLESVLCVHFICACFQDETEQ